MGSSHKWRVLQSVSHICFHRNAVAQHCSKNFKTCSKLELDKLCVNIAKRVLISIMGVQDVPVENVPDTTFKVCVCIQLTLSSLMSAIFATFDTAIAFIHKSDVPEPSS
jgi:hypothetical protein